MDGRKGRTRTQSSLLRSSPTVRSSIHSFSSANEITPEPEDDDDVDLDMDSEEQKPHRPGITHARAGSRWLPPVLALMLFSLCTLLVYSRREKVPTSENLLLALIFVALTLFYAGKSKLFIHKSFTISKHFWYEYTKKLKFYQSTSKSVQWYIGEPAQGQECNNYKPDKRAGRVLVTEGVEVFSNGDSYEGEFHKGKCNGSGVYNYFVKGRYEGDWINGKYDGYGVESWKRGSRYRGQYRQGLRHGYGEYNFYNGDAYAGEWLNGQSHGVGVQTCSDGSCYIGEFKLGVKHGLGCYYFRNGDRYAGEYFCDIIHGFGIYHFANGHCYEGSWHEGLKQGYGAYTFRRGDTTCGGWNCGNLKTPLTPQNDAVLRAIRAARQTADAAVHLGRVDEKVDQAVKAANRAAAAARVAAVKAVQNAMDGKL